MSISSELMFKSTTNTTKVLKKKSTASLKKIILKEREGENNKNDGRGGCLLSNAIVIFQFNSEPWKTNNISHPKLGHVSTVQPVHVCDLSTVQATRHLMKTEASLSN